MHVQAQEQSLPSSLRSKRVCSRRRLGMVNTTCRCATGEADLFGHVERGQQGAFLVAGGARAALLAGKGHEHLVPAIRAAHAGEALVQIAAA